MEIGCMDEHINGDIAWRGCVYCMFMLCIVSPICRIPRSLTAWTRVNHMLPLLVQKFE